MINSIISFYQKVRSRTEALCQPLQIEDYIPQPVVFASPPKWHIAHTTWFFETMVLKKFVPGYTVFDEQFNYLFNSYYNTIGERTVRAERGNSTRPGVERVFSYRAYVDKHMHALLENKLLAEKAHDLVVLGLNHEQQHQELLMTDLKYAFGHNPVFPVYDSNADWVGGRNLEEGWASFEEGVYAVGNTGSEFCYDNELGRHKTYIQPFTIAKGLVTNAEYLAFIADGGYKKFTLWLDEGWAWLNENQISSPMYWHQIKGKWFYYTLAGLKPIEEDAVLSHVSFYEAMAFAQWKGMRLPTEFEWEIAAPTLKWGMRWEWTNSAYLPYPGFSIAEGAVGEYNGKFMVNQMVLRGGSVATAEGHSRISYRNFFHPHYQWQYSGIRLVK